MSTHSADGYGAPDPTTAPPPPPAAHQPSPPGGPWPGTPGADSGHVRVAQDGHEVLLVELGAARERLSWMGTQLDQARAETQQVAERAEQWAALQSRTRDSALTWRLLAIIGYGIAAVLGLLWWGLSGTS